MPSFGFFILGILCAFPFPCPESLDFPYDYCGNFAKCGNISIKYPLGLWYYGCGNPNYQLTCFNNNPQLVIENKNYTVLGVSYANHSLTIVSEKLVHSCDPSDYSTFSLGSSNLTLANDNSGNITIFQFGPYTPPSIVSEYGLMSCNKSWYYSSNLSAEASRYISENFQVPLGSAINVTADPNFLQQGFQVKWQDDVKGEQSCETCISSGGFCGYNVSDSDFICYCKEGVQEKKCEQGRINPPEKGKKHLGAIIGGSAGGAVLLAAALMFVGIKITYQRRQGRLSNRNLLPGDRSNGASNNKEASVQATVGRLQIFSYEALREATNDFSDENQLGDGGFGCVYLAKLVDGRSAAVKKLYQGNSRRVQQFINEVQILLSLNHPNLVQLYGCTSTDSADLLLVYEYVPNGTLAEHLHGEKRGRSLSWDTRLNICIETAQALAFLHSQNPPIFHRDVKSTNILLDEHLKVKVADFGISRFVPVHATHVSTAPQGTPGYLDPDYHQCFQLTEKSDVYSFGVVLVEIISAKVAVDINRDRKDIGLANMAIGKIQEGALHELVDPSLEFSSNGQIKAMVNAVAELAFRCLAAEKDDRPDMKEMVFQLEQIKENGGRGGRRNQHVTPRLFSSGKDTKLHHGMAPLSPTSIQEIWPSTTTTPESIPCNN